MAKIRHECALRVPPMPAIEALESLLADIGKEAEGFEDFALHVNLASIGFPDVGYIAVPIRLELGEKRLQPAHVVDLSIHAKRKEGAFPAFRGTMGIEARDDITAFVWLEGDYEAPPLFPHSAAERTLKNFVDDMGTHIDARVEKRELARTRYAMMDIHS